MAIEIKKLFGIRHIRFLYLRLELHLLLKYYNGYFLHASDERLKHLYNVRKGKA